MLFSTDMDQLALVSRTAAAFVRDHDLTALAPGHYELGDGDCANVFECAGKDRAAASYEAHVVYADIQMVVSGSEFIEVAPVRDLAVTQPYSDADDCALYDGAYAGERFLLAPGRFCLVGPADGHMPGLACAPDAAPAKRIVFKIKMAHLEPSCRE